MKYKTLVKHAKQKAVVPILNCVRVKDGIASTTDLDFEISVPLNADAANLENNAVYHAHGFDKGIFIKADYPATDFPDMTAHGDEIGSATLEKKHLPSFEWTLLAASKEETRYYLNGIYFDDGVIVATDGHRLHSFKHDVQWGARKPVKPTKGKKKAEAAPDAPAKKGVILPTRACKMILEVMKETRADKFELVFFSNNRFAATIGEVTIEGKLIDGTFPDWRRVVPADDKLKGKTTLNGSEIKSILPQVEVLTRIDAGSRTRASIAIEKRKMRTTLFTKREWNVSTDIPFQAGFNLKYLIDVGSGVLEYTDAASPFKITDRRGGIDRMAVLMPLRV